MITTPHHTLCTIAGNSWRGVAGVACLLAFGVFAPAISAAQFAGAEAVLREALAAADIKPAEKTDTPDANAQLLADIKAFQANHARMEPATAAKNWLALFDRYAQMDTSVRFGSQPGVRARPVQPKDFIAALPGPAAWEALTKAVEARPAASGRGKYQELGLRTLVHTLTGDAAKRREDFDMLDGFAAKAKRSEAHLLRHILDNVWNASAASLDDPDALILALERKLAFQNPEHRYGTFDVPDLAGLAGEEKAEAFLRKALVESHQPLRIEQGVSTRALAAKLALELANDLKRPQWSLASSPDQVALYEAMDKKFGVKEQPKKPGATGVTGAIVALIAPSPSSMPDENSYEKNNARTHYFLGLLAQGRADDARKVANDFAREDHFSFPENVVREMERAGFTDQLNDFFRELLKQNPELPFWREYARIAAHAGKTSEMAELVRSSVAGGGVSASRQITMRVLLYNALLADDNAEAGVAELKQAIQVAAEKSQEKSSGGRRGFSSEHNRGALALDLARIGLVMNRADWMEEGIAIASEEARAQKETQQDGSWNEWAEWGAVEFSKILEKAGRVQEQEAVLGAALGRAMLKSKQQAAQSHGHYYESFQTARILTALARLYHRAGRHADVLYLLDNAPGWGAADIKELRGRYVEPDATPLGYYAAAALARTGRADEAGKQLEPLFAVAPGCDRLYELLLEFEGDAAPAKLDALFARDQFEERPLIWKAHWLRQHNRLEEAEAAARKAISIDPTDGEQPAGDRLRAYAELAEIRAARGDETEAASLRTIVEAVQDAEQADKLYATGLLRRAAALYESSLAKFAGAYCIHARLAVQLSSQGKYDEAAEHYRKAYELMPDSFGRVESYCFGCENTFDGPRAQGVAEKVFTQLAEKTPDKPQVHYLLGHLRHEQARNKEALGHYRKAVQLDPDYLNAWAKLNVISSHVRLSAAERDEIVFNLLRLDPLRRHGDVTFADVSNLAKLWKTLEEARAKWPPHEGPLYPLAASKAEIEKRRAEKEKTNNRMGVTFIEEENFHDTSRRSGVPASPADAVAQNRFIKVVMLLMQQRPESFGD